MPGSGTAIAAIALIALITFASRLAGPLVMSRVRLSPLVERFLDSLSVAVIAGLVASVLAQNGIREAAAVALAALVMFRTKSAVKALMTGMVVAAIWSLALA